MVNQPLQQESFFNFQKIIGKVLSKWYILLLSLAICLTLAFFVNRYTPAIYQVSTTVYLKEAKEKLTLAGLLTENTASATKNLEIESIVLRSYGLVKTTVEDLDLAVTYYNKGNVKTFELYKNSPIRVVIDSSSTFIPYNVPITCLIEKSASYSLHTEDENASLFSKQQHAFGKTITIKGLKLTIFLNEPLKMTTEEVIFKINHLDDIITYYQNNLDVWTNGKESTALILSLQSETPEKEIDFLNKHVANFIAENVEEKNVASGRTVAFINQLLESNSDSLNEVESQLEQFKASNSSINLSEKSTQLYSDIKLLEQQKASLITSNNFFNYVIDMLIQNNEVDQIIIPGHLGIKDPGLEVAIENMMAMQLENKLLKSEKLTKNPTIEFNNRKIAELKISISEKIKGLLSANKIALNDLNKKINIYLASQQQLPSAERQYVDIQRNYAISESLVQFLMQKRAEAGITQASNTSDYKIIDLARVEGGPIKPRPFKNYITAIIAGLVIPIALIFVLELFNNRITSKEDIQLLTSLPVLGMITRNFSKSDLLADDMQKSSLAESFRTLRSNLNYMLEGEGKAKIILFTSSVSGEGKSFCAKNLAYVLAISDKKTILINADMRKPNTSKEFGINGVAGLSNYLSGMVSLEEIIHKTNVDNLYIIKAGSIPPNPSELLLNTHSKELQKKLKEHFDFIIIDTPPIGVISDGLEFIKQADVTIFIVRQNYTLKPFMNNLNEVYHKLNHKNMAVLFNDVDLRKTESSYGYGYGYYTEDKMPKVWWKRIYNNKNKIVKIK